MPIADNSTAFLAGGGEMGAMMRAHDWSTSPVGSPEGWPLSLRSVVGLMLANKHIMFVAWGPELAFLYNDAYRPVFGKKHPWALGRPFKEIWSEVWDDVEPLVNAALGGEATWSENLHLVLLRNGYPEDCWFTFSYSPVYDESGSVAGLFCAATETTGQVLADRRLKEQAERQQFLFEKAPGFIAIMTGSDHTFEFVNDAYAQLLGQRDSIGRPVRQVFPDLVGQGFFEILGGVFASGERFVAQGIPIAFQTSSNQPARDAVLDFVYEPMRDEAGHVTGIFLEGHDVTEAHLAQVALQESEERLRRLNADLERQVIERTQARGVSWKVTPDLMGALNAEGRFETSNPAWQTMLGWSEAEVAAMPIWELLHPDDLERTREGLALTQIGQPAIQFTNRYRCKDGSYRWLSWVGVPDGGIVYCTGRDVTDEKAQAAELAQAQDALRLSQKMDAMGQLTGGVAHDFNNLLTPIIVGLELLRRSHDDARSQKLIGGALQSAERAKTLIQRLLTFARRQSLDARPVDLAALVEDMRDLIERSLGPAIKIVVDIADDLPAAMIDPGQLDLAILNLAVNARDAMPSGGVLTIAIASEAFEEGHFRDISPGQYVRLSVTDNGGGMDAETLARCTEPFFSTKETGQGTGLGLAMVHGLATQSGGAFKLTSQPGVGTQASLWIPATHRSVVAAMPRLPDAANAHHPATVLLIDDEELVRSSTAEGLRVLGYDVVEASSAAKALDLVARGLQPHLVITDHMMPSMTGAQLATELRSFAPSLPVLMITGYASMTPGQTDGLEVLAKPFGLTDLAVRVASILEHTPSTTSTSPTPQVGSGQDAR